MLNSILINLLMYLLLLFLFLGHRICEEKGTYKYQEEEKGLETFSFSSHGIDD
ncbi:hypothetical protein AAHE18_08G227300 [Arachis hypogaea]